MKSRKLITWIFAFLPLVITIIVLPMLPDKIPAHFGFDGEVTRYGSKYELLLTPIITVLFGFFWLLLEKVQKDEQGRKILFWGNICVSLTFTIITVFCLHAAFTKVQNINDLDIDFVKIMSVCLSMFCIMLGLILPKLKQNGLSGIRTSWTLKDENCWDKTHKFGGKIFLINGIISTILCLFVFKSWVALCFSLCGLIIISIIVVIYSHRVYKK
jgi:uncharacterized membrane protein